MTWTYAPEDIATTRKDEVRFLVGDTDESDPMVQDEEIALVLSQYPPIDGRPAWLAAAHVCDAIAGRFGRQVQRSIGSLSRAAQQQWEHYRQMAADLRLMNATNGLTSNGLSGIVAAAPVLGGGGPTFLAGDNVYMDPEGWN